MGISPQRIRLSAVDMTPTREEFGARLAAAREAAGYTIAVLAALAQVSERSIRYYEGGGRVPDVLAALRLAHALGTTIQDMTTQEVAMITRTLRSGAVLALTIEAADGRARIVASVDGAVVETGATIREMPLNEHRALVARGLPERMTHMLGRVPVTAPEATALTTALEAATWRPEGLHEIEEARRALAERKPVDPWI